jgi:hypothetical protein
MTPSNGSFSRITYVVTWFETGWLVTWRTALGAHNKIIAADTLEHFIEHMAALPVPRPVIILPAL